jgi:hypothetical protein
MNPCHKITSLFSRSASFSRVRACSTIKAKAKPTEISDNSEKSQQYKICGQCGNVAQNNSFYCFYCDRLFENKKIRESNNDKNSSSSAKMFHPHNGRDNFDCIDAHDGFLNKIEVIHCIVTPKIMDALQERINELCKIMSIQKADKQAKEEFGFCF